MALFQKKPQTSSSAPLYSLGLNKTLVIVGLGNVGKQYDGTRHNLGFAAINAFAAANDFPAWIEKKDLKSLVAAHNLGDSRIILIKPTTFMNLSGEAVQSVLHFYKVPANQMIVLHDELDLPFGQLRSKSGGGSAGHNGVESISEHVGPNFNRLRIGIHNELADLAEGKVFVLGKLSKDEQAHLKALTKEVNSMLSEYIFSSGQLHAETRSFIV